MTENAIHVALLKFQIFIPFSNSLKTKRTITKSIKDKIRNRFNVSVAETGDLDKWQTSVFTAALVGSDKDYLGQEIDRIIRFVESSYDAEITDYDVEYL